MYIIIFIKILDLWCSHYLSCMPFMLAIYPSILFSYVLIIPLYPLFNFFLCKCFSSIISLCLPLVLQWPYPEMGICHFFSFNPHDLTHMFVSLNNILFSFAGFWALWSNVEFSLLKLLKFNIILLCHSYHSHD